MKTENELEKIKSLWAQEADKYVLRAATEDLEQYTPEIQDIIKSEAIKRGLCNLLTFE